MTNNIEIREIGDSEIPSAFHLHNNYTGENRTSEKWLWEYRSISPEKSVFVVAKDGDKIIGTQGMLPIYLDIGGEKVLTGKSENTLLDKAYRGRGLLEKMYATAMKDCEKNGMACIWGYTTATKIWREKLIFHVYDGAMKWAILPLDFGTLKKEKSRLLKTHSKIKSVIVDVAVKSVIIYSRMRRYLSMFSQPKKNLGYELMDKPKSWTDVISFYDTLRKEYPNLICIHQDNEYLNWRLYENPYNKPITFFAYAGDCLEGYLYLTVREKILEITDFMFRNTKAGMCLMNIILNKINEQKIAAVMYSGNIYNPLNKKNFSLLKRFGFIIIKRPSAFVLKNIDRSNDELIYDIRNWCLTDLWSEGT